MNNEQDALDRPKKKTKLGKNHGRIEMLFTVGMFLVIDGYSYEVSRLAGPLTFIKRLRPADGGTNLEARVLKKNDEFNIRVGLVTHNFKVISATGRSWFSIKRMLEKK